MERNEKKQEETGENEKKLKDTGRNGKKQERQEETEKTRKETGRNLEEA